MDSSSSSPSISTSINISVTSPHQSPKDKDKDKGGGEFSMPIMLGDREKKDMVRSVSFERFMNESNERIVLNVGGKRFETYL